MRPSDHRASRRDRQSRRVGESNAQSSSRRDSEDRVSSRRDSVDRGDSGHRRSRSRSRSRETSKSWSEMKGKLAADRAAVAARGSRSDKATNVAPKGGLEMIEIVVNDRLGKKSRVKCSPRDSVGDLKKLIAMQTGTRPEKIRLQKWYSIFKDHLTLDDYEIHDGMSIELYYN